MLTEKQRSNNLEDNVEPPKKHPNHITLDRDFDLMESVLQT
jgi:hypothetical protein